MWQSLEHYPTIPTNSGSLTGPFVAYGPIRLLEYYVPSKETSRLKPLTHSPLI